MDAQAIFSAIFFIVFGLGIANAVYRFVKNRGWKGGMFGAPVGKRTCELDLGRHGMMNTKLKVYVLEPRDTNDGPQVGIEVIRSTIGSWHMTPVSLTRNDALRFAEGISQAARDSNSGAASILGSRLETGRKGQIGEVTREPR
jgi:hypothetical protein